MRIEGKVMKQDKDGEVFELLISKIKRGDIDCFPKEIEVEIENCHYFINPMEYLTDNQCYFILGYLHGMGYCEDGSCCCV